MQRADDASVRCPESCVHARRGEKLRLMPNRVCIFACASLGLAQLTAVSAADLENNPLLTESSLPYHVPAFDKIKDEHFAPAIEEGMRQELKEVEAIANDTEKLRCGQGKAQENQRRAGNFADSIRTKCVEGKERIVGSCRSQGRPARSFR
ncbi:MAG: hypothetical protein DME65_06300 [Verrucomicrobia bacterium]|nr:MAG: hypothetical protein DME65_06300 [Verrucomicrobiota bacterium]